MDIRRVILYAALAFVVYSLGTSWQKDYPLQHATAVTDGNQSTNTLLPAVSDSQSTTTDAANPIQMASESSASQKISVKTDVLSLEIDLKQGDIISANLLDYPISVEEKNKPFSLLRDTTSERYVANSSLFVVKQQTPVNMDLNYRTSQSSYQLDGQDQLWVTLQGQSAEGLEVTKQFLFKKGSYLIEVRYQIKNLGTSPWIGYMNTQLLRSSPQEDKSSLFHVGSYTGASYSNPGHHRYEKVSFKDMAKSNLDLEVHSGWLAMQQHYFLTAWIPAADSTNRFYTRSIEGTYTIGAVSKAIELTPGTEKKIAANLYVGPEIASVLQGISPGLDLTIDYGWLWFLSSLLFSLMKAIYSIVGNWGWSIVLVTALIKLLFYRLSATSYRSMASMRKLQPKLQALRERHGDDKAKMSQATMELYRQEKVNPLGGCLPIVIQIPVFIALYWVLLESVELRQAPFIFWIQDLATADPLHVLPVIMGATMLIQQKLNPAPPDPTQAKVMMFLPILFTGLFWGFPAGLVLYWIVNNTLSILQQWYITRQYRDDESSQKNKPSKKLASVK